MKKGETYTGRVQHVDFPNKAVVFTESENPEDNGQKVIVKNSIPGQKVRFMVNKKRGGKCEGRLLQVLENAPSETADRCKHFGTCGGCVYQSVQYEEQLKMKEAQVHKLLSEAVDGELNFEGIIGSPCQEAYRNKMEFSFGDELKCGNRSVFSRRLQELIQQRLAAKEQIILFLNKRGYAGFVSCRMCGHVLKCPHCDISLTEHKNGKMVCHYCGYEQPRVTRCPVCGSKYISGFRAGTQQIEEAVKKMYPQARVLRMDMDTTAGKEGHEKILAAFSAQEADILVGTQMIVKGHDFPNVTLVGVLAADMSLYAGDYRAAERTFELLTQAAGRAGRGKRAGEVVIQTYTPQHYSIAAAAAQNYEQFYEEEIAFRSIMDYPPVCNMLMVTLSSKNEEQLLAACTFLKEVIPEWKKEQVRITGPVAAGVYKRNDYYNQVMYLKATAYEKLTACKDRLETLCRENTLFRSIGLQFDFN